jgi:hypothetical protein
MQLVKFNDGKEDIQIFSSEISSKTLDAIDKLRLPTPSTFLESQRGCYANINETAAGLREKFVGTFSTAQLQAAQRFSLYEPFQ